MPNIIFSTVGTSSLTKRNAEAERINDLSNLIENELSNGDREFLNNQLLIKENEIDNIFNNLQQLKEFSAELNGILTFYNINNLNNIDNQILTMDYHILIATDTYVGKLTSNLIKEILNRLGFNNVYIEPIDKLNTKNTENFTEGVKNLRNVIYQNYILEAGYNNYKKILNLTGGFKSVNAFLNILGMFYADEIIYVFETKTDLIKIPKLPIKIDYERLKELYEEFLLINTADGMEKSGIDPIFLYIIDNRYILNEWGEFIWQEIKDSVINEKKLPRFNNIQYDNIINRQFDVLQPIEKELFALRIATLSKVGQISDILRRQPLNLNQDTDGHSEYKIELKDNIRIFLNYDENQRKFRILSIRQHRSGRYELI